MKYEMFAINEKIAEVLDKFMDIETGEISEEGVAEIERLSLKREEVIESIALAIKNNEALQVSMEAQIESFKKRIAQKQRAVDWLTRVLRKNVNEGEKFSTPTFEIKWTKSNRIDVDPVLADPEAYAKDKSFKKYINKKEVVTYSWDKSALANLHKEGKVLPSGITYVSSKNLKVK